MGSYCSFDMLHFYEYYYSKHSTYFKSLLFWMIAQNVRENVTNPFPAIG